MSYTDTDPGIGNVLRSAQAAIEKSSEDYETARTIQDRLLPSELPHVCGIECFGQCERCGNLGGDFFDFFSASPNELTAVIGNVAITGTAGAILLTGLQACVRTLAAHGAAMADLAAEANRMLWGIAPENSFATMFSARLNRNRHQLEYTSAGHQASFIVRSDGRFVWLEPNAAVLGLSRASVYRPRTVAFGPGDTLIAASEGMAETANHQSIEVRERGLLRLVEDTLRTRARELPARIIGEFESLKGPGPMDRSVIVVRYQNGDGRGVAAVPGGMRVPPLRALAA